MPPIYSPVPTSDPQAQAIDKQEIDLESSSIRRERRTALKKFVFHILAAIAIMYALVLAVKEIPSACRMITSKGLLVKNVAAANAQNLVGCHGANRTLSTAAGLPKFHTLPSGDKIPSVALGVWRADPGHVGEAVKTALKAGYRHIDGAWIYGNEVEVGKAIRESGVARKDIWITSKLWNSFHAPEDVEPALDESLARLGTDYIDLYLIHWPVAFKKGGGQEVDFTLTDNPYPTWQKLEEMVVKGKVRNIGVSNFNIRRLQNLTANSLKFRPAVNQVELSYWNPQPDLLKWAKENELLLEAYSPLGSQNKVKETLQIPEIKSIAKELGITPAQVVISWHVQRGTVVLPKSVTPSRVVENFHVVPLPQEVFDRLERAAVSHKPERSVNPDWGVDIWN